MCPLYTGSNYMDYSSNGENGTTLNRQRFVKAGFVNEFFKIEKGSRSITIIPSLKIITTFDFG